MVILVLLLQTALQPCSSDKSQHRILIKNIEMKNLSLKMLKRKQKPEEARGGEKLLLSRRCEIKVV